LLKTLRLTCHARSVFNDWSYNYYIELSSEVIVKEKPYFFYYKEAKSETNGERIERDPNSKSEPPELDFQD